MPIIPGNDLDLGILPGRNASLQFPRTARDKHLYVCGGTGTGKSKFLEHLIRQDIKAWHKSKCGMLVLDPHGSLYDSLMQWLAWHKIERPIVPIDLRQDDWIISYNLLRERKQIDPAVLIDNLTDAIAHVWGAGGTDQTPRFARWVGNILRPLYEKKYTLLEAEHLIDSLGNHMRYLLTADLKDRAARQDWEFADTLNPRDFEAQVGSTVNRLQRFIRNQTMRTTFGLPDVSLDLGRAIEEGQIVLVSLSTERGKISEENASLFGTLLLTDLWTAAKERGKPIDGRPKPFYVYIDEFQEFITPTIAKNLDQARGYGLHLTLANQFLGQLLAHGSAGEQVYKSVMENASSKVVFRLTDEENLMPMAKWLFRGTLNPDQIKHELYSTKVMSYREELKEVRGRSTSSGFSSGKSRGSSSGAGRGGTESFAGDEETEIRSHSESESEFAAESRSESESWSESSTESLSLVPTLVPVMGRELSHVQFRSLDEQLFRSMAVLFDQEERHGVARLVGMSIPASIRTPDVSKMPGSPERTARYLESCYKKLPFALQGADAQKRIAERAASLSANLTKEFSPEPGSAKRKITRTVDK